MKNKDQNRQLRRELLARRRNLSSEWIKTHSEIISNQIRNWPPFCQAHTIMAYLAMPDEPQLDWIIEQALQEGKKVSVPRTTSVYGHMESWTLSNLMDVQLDKLGIRTPLFGNSKQVSPTELDLILVPGVAFDRNGHRIGMGAGYYDRFLIQAPQATTLAITWSFQVDSHLETQPWDVPIQYIVTERELFFTGRVRR